MFEWLERFFWIHFGIKWSEPYGHHICKRCMKIFFCEQSNIHLPRCTATDSGKHDDYEVDCNCMRIKK